jgi:hypothetical protein
MSLLLSIATAALMSPAQPQAQVSLAQPVAKQWTQARRDLEDPIYCGTPWPGQKPPKPQPLPKAFDQQEFARQLQAIKKISISK